MADPRYLELKSSRLEAVRGWRAGRHGVCNDIAAPQLAISPEDTNTTQTTNVPGMSNVLFTGFQLNGVDLSVTDQRQETSPGHFGASPVRNTLRNKVSTDRH